MWSSSFAQFAWCQRRALVLLSPILMGLWIFQILYTNIFRKTVFLRCWCTLQGSSPGLERRQSRTAAYFCSAALPWWGWADNLQISCLKNVASLVWWVPQTCIFEHVAVNGDFCSNRGIWDCVWWLLKYYCNNEGKLGAFRGKLSLFSSLIICCAIFKAGLVHRNSGRICFMHYLRECCIKKGWNE